jgi:SPP1 family predicted phage head-tail adaptor
MNRDKKTFASESPHYVTITRKSSVSDGQGGFTDTWSNVSSCFAKVKPIKAVQVQEYKSINVNATHLVTFRGYTDVTEFDRIKVGNRTLDVLTVENINENDFELVVTCNEVRS